MKIQNLKFNYSDVIGSSDVQIEKCLNKPMTYKITEVFQKAYCILEEKLKINTQLKPILDLLLLINTLTK